MNRVSANPSTPRRRTLSAVLAASIGIATLSASVACAQESKTVIGPTNPELAAGADALRAGDAEEGVRLTLQGLKMPATSRQRVVGLTNLCAGYVMLDQFEAALPYCDEAIALNDRHWRAYNNRALAFVLLDRLDDAERDLARAESIAPNARTLRVVRAMLLDKTDPVAPSIVIDDRRDAGQSDD